VAHDARGLVEFLSYVIDAAGEYKHQSPSVIKIGNSKVTINEAGARGPTAAFLYVYVADVDAVYRRALDHGASSVEEPFDTLYGDPRCMVVDKWGNAWQIAVYASDS